MEKKKSNALAVCALVFSLLVGLVGLILGIIGANSYEQGTSGKTMSILAIVFSCLNMIFGFILVAAAA